MKKKKRKKRVRGGPAIKKRLEPRTGHTPTIFTNMDMIFRHDGVVHALIDALTFWDQRTMFLLISLET